MTISLEGRTITDESMCDFDGSRCTIYNPTEVQGIVADAKLEGCSPITFPNGCFHYGKLNGGEFCAGACEIRDYNPDEKWRRSQFKKKLDSGELELLD